MTEIFGHSLKDRPVEKWECRDSERRMAMADTQRNHDRSKSYEQEAGSLFRKAKKVEKVIGSRELIKQ